MSEPATNFYLYINFKLNSFVLNKGKIMKNDSFLRDDGAQGMTEYVLLVFLIALAAYFGVQMYGGKMAAAYDRGTARLK